MYGRNAGPRYTDFFTVSMFWNTPSKKFFLEVANLVVDEPEVRMRGQHMPHAVMAHGVSEKGIPLDIFEVLIDEFNGLTKHGMDLVGLRNGGESGIFLQLEPSVVLETFQRLVIEILSPYTDKMYMEGIWRPLVYLGRKVKSKEELAGLNAKGRVYPSHIAIGNLVGESWGFKKVVDQKVLQEMLHQHV